MTYDNETQFIHDTIRSLGIDTFAWSEMDEQQRSELLAALARRREHAVILER